MPKPSKQLAALTAFSAFITLTIATAAVWAINRDGAAPIAQLRVVVEYPHDPVAFTQGLVIRDGIANESTGLYGQSSLRRIDIKSGEIKQFVPIDDSIFAEGITVIGDELYLLSWQNKTGYVFKRDDLTYHRSFRYSGEGWGLTDDGKHLIMSDGSSVLRFLDPATADVVKRLPVRDAGRPVERLNELEYVDGEILANVWYTDRIARISATTGQVVGWLDASPLRKQVELADSKEDVLNGIAYDRATKKLYVTGKRWPKLFEVEITR